MDKGKAYVDSESQIEQQPDDNDWRKSASNLRRTQRLDQKEADQNRASCADDGRRGDVRFDDFEATSFVVIDPLLAG